MFLTFLKITGQPVPTNAFVSSMLNIWADEKDNWKNSTHTLSSSSPESDNTPCFWDLSLGME